MKATLIGKMQNLAVSEGGSIVRVTFNAAGNVDDAKGFDAKDIDATLTLAIKPLVAEELHFGEIVHITISTEPPRT